jgi:type II secretory pathway pseudopilin PulG
MKGFTLIEIIIFTLLLSYLLSGFIQYSFVLHQDDLKLINKIQNEL